MSFKGLTLGVPREVMHGERRVAVSPVTACKMIEAGARVLVETGAGLGSHFPDDEYRAAGAEVLGGVEDLFARSQVILKVKELQYREGLGKHEVDMMRPGQYVIAFLHPAAPDNHQLIERIAARGVISFSLDSIPRTSRAQPMDALTSMSTVAGYKAVLMAADRIPKFVPMIGTPVGTHEPATALVIGTGVAGLQAVATAKRLGAVVHAADVREEACIHAKSLGAKLVPLGIPSGIAVGEGGYAKTLSDEWLEKERAALRESVARADMIIATALVPGREAPTLITDDMVRSMKPGSAIVDVAIDQGGNCESTVHGQVTEKYSVSIDGTKNIPGMMPTSSTWMFTNNILNYLSYIVKDGRIDIDADDEIIQSSLVTRDGKIVHAGTMDSMEHHRKVEARG